MGETSMTVATNQNGGDLARPHPCPHPGCNKRFTIKGNLRRHTESTHIGSRRFSCPTCGKSFARRGDVTIHLRVHTGERPYPCTHENCGRRFARLSDLKGHVRTHGNCLPFFCQVEGCDKHFSRRFDLKKHVTAHHPGHPMPDFSSSNSDGGSSGSSDTESVTSSKLQPVEPPLVHKPVTMAPLYSIDNNVASGPRVTPPAPSGGVASERPRLTVPPPFLGGAAKMDEGLLDRQQLLRSQGPLCQVPPSPLPAVVTGAHSNLTAQAYHGEIQRSFSEELGEYLSQDPDIVAFLQNELATQRHYAGQRMTGPPTPGGNTVGGRYGAPPDVECTNYPPPPAGNGMECDILTLDGDAWELFGNDLRVLQSLGPWSDGFQAPPASGAGASTASNSPQSGGW